jgi:hypothetical protein
MTGTTVIKAIGYKATVTSSAVVSASYSVTTSGGSKVATPTFNPDGFVSPGHGAQTVTIATTTAGAQMRYTKDRSIPTSTHGTLISGISGTANIPAGTEKTLQAIAFKSGLLDSDIKFAVYDFTS